MKKILQSFLCIALLMISILSVGAAVNDEPSGVAIKISLLNQDPTPARAGNNLDVRFSVQNTGASAAEDFQMEVMQESPFTVIDGSAQQNLGTVKAYQAGENFINVKYRLKVDKDAQKGAHDLKVRYRTGSSFWTVQTFPIEVTNKEFAQIIYVDKAELQPGKQTDLKFTITNIGNAPLQNLIFSWTEAKGVVLPVYSDNTKYIKYLDVGQSTDLVYTVVADVNVQPGLYQIDLSLKYESLSNATASIITTKAGVLVGGVTDFDVAFSQSSAGTTSLSVANTGNNPAQSVSVRIPLQESVQLQGTNSAIIGNLDKGDYTLVSFQMSPRANATRAGQGRQGGFTGTRQQATDANQSFTARNSSSMGNVLRVIIDYTDTTGVRRSVEKYVSIQFRTSTGTGTNGGQQASASIWQSTWFWVISIIVIIGGYMFYRRSSGAKNKK